MNKPQQPPPPPIQRPIYDIELLRAALSQLLHEVLEAQERRQMTDDLRKWRVYNPLDPWWDFPPARNALEAKTQAEVLVLRYRDHRSTSSEVDKALSIVAEAIRNLPCSSPTSAAPSSPTPDTSSSK